MRPQLIFKGKNFYIHYFAEAVGNNVNTCSPFNAAVIACF